MPPIPTPKRRRALAPGILLPVLLLAGCLVPPEGEEEGKRPYVPLPSPEPQTIGFFLTQFDKSLVRWGDLKLQADQPRELRQLTALERNLQKRSAERLDELLQVMEGGPPVNRRVAAVALGFTRDERALSPLLTALSDRDPEVVQKALLGIGLLAVPETPTTEITNILVSHHDPWTRNNAAYALQCIVSAGGADPALAAECRDALVDEEPGVRAQCASVLGLLQDPEAVPSLGDLLLYDEVNLVSAAAAKSLARIGRFQLESKGKVARLLVQSLDQVEGRRKPAILRELVWMSDRNLGEDAEDWREWAHRLP